LYSPAPKKGKVVHRDFVCLIGSDEGHACDMLDSIKTELDSNEMLLTDFPEVCFPIQALDGISNRARGRQPSSIALTKKRWMPVRSSRGPSGSITTNYQQSSMR